jgi:hypothetical protein
VKSLFASAFFPSVKTPAVKPRFKIINIFCLKPAPGKDLEDFYFLKRYGKNDFSNVAEYFLLLAKLTGKNDFLDVVVYFKYFLKQTGKKGISNVVGFILKI